MKEQLTGFQTPDKSFRIIKGDEIDIVALVKTIWAGRKIIFYSVVVCFVIGLIIAFASPKKYTASAKLIPSAEDKSINMGGLGSLAGLAGVNLNSMMGDASGIPSELYPQVVASVPYLMELMHEKLTWERYNKPMSILEVIEEAKKKNKESVILKYTIKLPWTIKNALMGKELNKLDVNSDEKKGYLNLNPEEQKAIGLLKEAIKVEIDKKSSLITLYVEMGEPLLTAQLADKAINLLQKQVIAYKTKQSIEKLVFIEARYAEMKSEYETTSDNLLYYKDVHRDMVSERSDIEYQRLSDAYDMASTIYKGLAQQLEQARITVKEETPVFTVLEPVLVPKDKSAPKRGMIMGVSFFLGLLLGIGVVFLKNIIPNFSNNA